MATDSEAEAQTAVTYLRSFITILVIGHHSLIAYGRYQRFDSAHYLDGAPLVDASRWVGFDVFVLFNDTFFMALMFLIAGLFTLPSIARRGARGYLRERARRLGLPFVLAVTAIMPVAYYPSYLATGADVTFLEFWWQTLSVGPWPGGPAWFLWVLLAFAALVVVVQRLAPRALSALSALDVRAHDEPQRFWIWLLVLSLAAYMPMLLLYGPGHWFSCGPFAVQASRLLFYATYFLIGSAIGPATFRAGLLARDGALARGWRRWGSIATVAFGLIVLANLARMSKWIGWSAEAWDAGYGVLFALGCASISCALLAVFVRFVVRRRALFDRFSLHAYTIYVVHYVFVIWLQRLFLDVALPAVVKGVSVLVLTVACSWALAVVVHALPSSAWRRRRSAREQVH